jgi:hypothetical protein
MRVLTYGAGAIIGAALAVAAIGYLTAEPARMETKPIPKVKPLDMGRALEEMVYRQQGRDLQNLGKMGPAHDRWLFERALPPKDYDRLKSRPLNPAAPAKPANRIPARQPGARDT